MKIDWSRLALEERVAIFDYIELESHAAACRIDDRILSSIERLEMFPEMGRPGRVDGTRELVITGTPYVAAYRITKGTLLILRLLHGALPWPIDLV